MGEVVVESVAGVIYGLAQLVKVVENGGLHKGTFRMSLYVPHRLQNCILRDFVKSDVQVIADIESDADVKKYIGLPDSARADWVKSFHPDDLRGWAIEAIPEQTLAGRASISRPKDPAPFGILELQIVIAKPFWGRKLGRQVAAALIQYAFNDSRTVAVIAQVHPENRAIHLLLEAFSFVPDGTDNSGKRLTFRLDRARYTSLPQA